MSSERLAASRYGSVAQLLHWVIAGLVVTQFLLAGAAHDLPLGPHKLALLARHKSVGMTVLLLAVIRLIWRLTHAAEIPPAQPGILGRLARAAHFAFYVLLFAMPLSGWLMSSAKGYSVSWFGLFTWPDLVAADPGVFHAFQSAHGIMAGTLLFLALLHTGAALKHHFWNRDAVLTRMLPFVRARKPP